MGGTDRSRLVEVGSTLFSTELSVVRSGFKLIWIVVFNGCIFCGGFVWLFFFVNAQTQFQAVSCIFLLLRY